MIKLKSRSFSLKRIATTGIFAFAIMASQFANIPFASAATTVTWDGSAGDDLFSTAANWSGDAVPVNGDTLAFDVGTLAADATITNDITALSVGGIAFTGDDTGDYGKYIITGNAMTLTGDITNTSVRNGYPLANAIQANMTLGASVSISNIAYIGATASTIDTGSYTLGLNSTTSCLLAPHLTGDGAITVNSSGEYTSQLFRSNNTGLTGTITVNSGVLSVDSDGFGSTSAGTTVSGSGILQLISPVNSSWAEPLNLSGTGSIAAEQKGSACSGGSGTKVTATLTGAVTLGSDFKYSGSQNLKVTGAYTANGHNFTVASGADGTLTTPAGETVAPNETVQLDGDTEENISVGNSQTAVLNGSRGTITVSAGGKLKGTGTAATIYIQSNGVVAPGNSPGTLTALDSFTLSGMYEAELLNATTYDQLAVGENYGGSGSAVSLNEGSTLGLVLYDGWVISKGDAFTIIDNLSSTDVSGIFDDMAEGSQMSIDGITFSISYVGGDGNDVVLTALNTGNDPSAPNTGFAQTVIGNPVTIVALGLASAGILAAVAIRRRTNS